MKLNRIIDVEYVCWGLSKGYILTSYGEWNDKKTWKLSTYFTHAFQLKRAKFSQKVHRMKINFLLYLTHSTLVGNQKVINHSTKE